MLLTADTVLNGAGITFEQTVDSAPYVDYATNFEAGLGGFTIDNTYGPGNGLWHLSTGRSADGLPNHSPDYSLYYGQGETSTSGGNYNTGTTNAGTATSPVIHVPPSGTTTLTFHYFRDAETGNFDVTSVDEIDGGTTTLLSSYDGSIGNTAGAWTTATVDLTPFAGTDIQLRFTFNTIDNVLNGTEGWFVDDVNVETAAFALTISDGGTTNFMGPVGGTSPLASLTTNATGETDINGGAITTTGAQDYQDKVVLTQDTTITGAGITFEQTVDSDATARR